MSAHHRWAKMKTPDTLPNGALGSVDWCRLCNIRRTPNPDAPSKMLYRWRGGTWRHYTGGGTPPCEAVPQDAKRCASCGAMTPNHTPGCEAEP